MAPIATLCPVVSRVETLRELITRFLRPQTIDGNCSNASTGEASNLSRSMVSYRAEHVCLMVRENAKSIPKPRFKFKRSHQGQHTQESEIRRCIRVGREEPGLRDDDPLRNLSDPKSVLAIRTVVMCVRTSYTTQSPSIGKTCDCTILRLLNPSHNLVPYNVVKAPSRRL